MKLSSDTRDSSSPDLRPIWVVGGGAVLSLTALAAAQFYGLLPTLPSRQAWMGPALAAAAACAIVGVAGMLLRRSRRAAPAAHEAPAQQPQADATHAFIASIVTELATTSHDEFDRTLAQVLHRLGDELRADAVYITLIDRAARSAIRHQWRGDHAPAPLLSQLPVSPQMLRERAIVQLPARDMDHDSRPQPCCMVTGLFAQGEMIGSLRVESARRSRPWPPEAQTLMGTLGPILASVLLRRRTEQALMEKHAVLDALINATPDLIFIKDQYGRFMGVNAAMATLHRRMPEDMVGLTDDALHPRELAEHYRRCDQQVITTGERMQVEEWIENMQGERCLVETVKTPYRGPDGQPLGLVGIARDITTRRRAQELEVERQRLVATSRAMDQVLGVVGHDLRTPLACMRALCEALLDGEVSDADEKIRFLQGIHDETLRLTDWANHMLEAARLNSGIAAWRWDELDLRKICEESLEVARPLLRDTVKLLVDVVPPTLAMRGDSSAIRRLLLNLLTNASRHTTEGSITVTMRATQDEQGRDAILMSVSDTGCGIEPDDAAKLGFAFALNRHHRKDSQQRELGGMGLGLAICNQIAAAHGGRITVRSEPGVGSTFEVLMRSDLDRPITHETPEPIRTEFPHTAAAR